MESSPDRTPASASLLANRVNDVIDAVELRDSRRYSGRWIAQRSTELGYPLTAANLSHIRVGRVRNPSFQVIEGIAKALDVDVHAFLSDGPVITGAAGGAAVVRFRSFDVGGLNDLGRETFESVAASLLADLGRKDEFRNPPPSGSAAADSNDGSFDGADEDRDDVR